MDITTILQLYAALLVVITLHEIGHFPEKIKFKLGIIPQAVAIRAKYRLGGLIMNVAIFLTIFALKPENIFLQYVGLISWIHFILYAIFGSIIPEPKESSVNINTYVFDDVPNKYAFQFISAAIISILTLGGYYWPIFAGVIA